jgi:cytochrome b561
MALTLAVLVALHVAGVLYHVFVKKDRVLARMLRGAP